MFIETLRREYRERMEMSRDALALKFLRIRKSNVPRKKICAIMPKPMSQCSNEPICQSLNGDGLAHWEIGKLAHSYFLRW
jgi:hypothetical protein